MAIYLLHVKAFSRAKGGRVTRAAAYRAGERIRDERTREVYNFSDRDDILHKEIFVPSEYSGDRTLDWARDRSTLWNAAEQTDRRNARLGRELLILLPPEMSPAQRTQLVQRFARDLADRYHSAVDATIHLPRPTADVRQHHAHLLMTCREVTPQGLGPRTSLELSCAERHAAGLGPYKADFIWARERWGELLNEALKTAGFTTRVDHRGARARGIDHEPVPLIPQKILYMERRSGPTQAGNDIRRRYRERVEARLKGPGELERTLKAQRAENRQRILQRSQQKESAPSKVAWSALTKEEIAERRRARYQANKDRLNEKRRAYYQENREALREKKREARRLARPTPEQRSAQRWLKWRQQHPEQVAEPPGVQTPSHTPTPNQAVRNWLAYKDARERLQAPRGPDNTPTQERSTASHSKNDDDSPRKPHRDRDYEHEL